MGMGVFYALIRQFRSVKSKIWNPLGGGGGGGGGYSAPRICPFSCLSTVLVSFHFICCLDTSSFYITLDNNYLIGTNFRVSILNI